MVNASFEVDKIHNTPIHSSVGTAQTAVGLTTAGGKRLGYLGTTAVGLGTSEAEQGRR